MEADLDAIIRSQILSDEQVQFLTYQILRGLKVEQHSKSVKMTTFLGLRASSDHMLNSFTSRVVLENYFNQAKSAVLTRKAIFILLWFVCKILYIM